MQATKWMLSLIVTLLFSLSCYAADTTFSKMKWPPSMVFSDQKWQLGFHDENDDLAMAEYVTRGETVENWTELVTFQEFKLAFPPQVTPIAFADKQIEGLKAKGYEIIYTNIESSAKEAIIEFQVKSPVAQQQDEIQRLIRMPNNTFVILHYVIKKYDMGNTERAKWVQVLKMINISAFNVK